MQKNKATEKNKPKNLGGRPSDYTQEKGDLICERVATHTVGIPRLCKMYSDIPCESVINRWRYKHEEFKVKYAQAKMIQADLLAEECLEIADNCTFESAAAARLQIDTRKWLASKLLPKQYGDTRLLEQKTEENEQLKEELRVLREKLDLSNKREF